MSSSPQDLNQRLESLLRAVRIVSGSDVPMSVENIVGQMPTQEEIRTDEETRAQKLKNDGTETDLELKKLICRWVKWVVSIYLIFIAGIIGRITYEKGLSDPVLIALLTTTTINILGLPLMIILSLFPSKKK
jgi:hypothetical protein